MPGGGSRSGHIPHPKFAMGVRQSSTRIVEDWLPKDDIWNVAPETGFEPVTR